MIVNLGYSEKINTQGGDFQLYPFKNVEQRGSRQERFGTGYQINTSPTTKTIISFQDLSFKHCGTPRIFEVPTAYHQMYSARYERRSPRGFGL